MNINNLFYSIYKNILVVIYFHTCIDLKKTIKRFDHQSLYIGLLTILFMSDCTGNACITHITVTMVLSSEEAVIDLTINSCGFSFVSVKLARSEVTLT